MRQASFGICPEAVFDLTFAGSRYSGATQLPTVHTPTVLAHVEVGHFLTQPDNPLPTWCCALRASSVVGFVAGTLSVQPTTRYRVVRQPFYPAIWRGPCATYFRATTTPTKTSNDGRRRGANQPGGMPRRSIPTQGLALYYTRRSSGGGSHGRGARARLHPRGCAQL